MQKVEGSSPFIRLTEVPETGLFCAPGSMGLANASPQVADWRTSPSAPVSVRVYANAPICSVK